MPISNKRPVQSSASEMQRTSNLTDSERVIISEMQSYMDSLNQYRNNLYNTSIPNYRDSIPKLEFHETKFQHFLRCVFGINDRIYRNLINREDLLVKPRSFRIRYKIFHWIDKLSF